MNEFRRNALSLAHIAWATGLVCASVFALFSGSSAIGTLIALGAGMLPVAAFFYLRTSLARGDSDSGRSPISTSGPQNLLRTVDAENLLIVVWLIMSTCLASLVSPGRSAAGLVVILAPLLALLIGRSSLVRETAAFSLIVSVGLFVLRLIDGGLSGFPGITPLEAPLAIMVVGTGLIIVLLIAQGASESDQALKKQMSAAEASARRMAAHALIPDIPWLVVQVTPYGRIRSVLGGETYWWPELVAGGHINTAFPDLQTALTSSGKALSPLGDELSVRKSKLVDGSYALLITADSETSPQTDEADIDQSDWLLGLSHDLKSPLNAILGFSELMMVEQFGPLPDRYAKYPSMIHKSGAQLQSLINDIMDISKTGANRYEIDREPIDLHDVSLEIADQFENLADQAGVRLVTTGQNQVIADADHRAVYRIWQNLVSNAIKYSNPGGTVKLGAALSGGFAMISVTDDGIGMDEADLNRIAEPFAQGANSKGKAGTGLGLSVVRTFAELHGGKMVIDTAPGAGTRIDVYLPASQTLDRAAE